MNEQFKIADFLTTLDRKVNLLEKKLDIFKDFKKFCMEQLFAQKLRFKNANGENYPDWEKMKLSDIFVVGKAGGTPKSTEDEYYNGDIPFLSIADMTSQGKYISNTTKTITKEGLNNSSAWIVPENSLLYSIYASVGFVAINKTPMSTSQAIFGIILKNNINIEYIYYYLLDYKKYIHRLTETGTQGNLNSKIVNDIIINTPTKEEQDIIANFLTEIDNKIDKIAIELENTKEFKKGLLQQMFC
ncbi:EcoKI restriction-modification system protein HsdS [Methanobrevibacter curvatus]|uniref:EcoKI restriction-modification system protein HsdS n=2 Tax=Methanobrevibacter curvatus TaxID=49547 RepID=A0A165Z604_9EURY|nr:EcoKI restriction-modification system protein HsdS [Methanobrevibacter curvatus]